MKTLTAPQLQAKLDQIDADYREANAKIPTDSLEAMTAHFEALAAVCPASALMSFLANTHPRGTALACLGIKRLMAALVLSRKESEALNDH